MKETIKGLDKAFRKTKDDTSKLMEISKEQFNLKQEFNRIGNEIWNLKKSRVKIGGQLSDLENEKDEIFIKMGLKEVKVTVKKK